MGTTKHENTVVVRAGIKPAPTQFQLAGPMNNEKTTGVGAGFIPALQHSNRLQGRFKINFRIKGRLL